MNGLMSEIYLEPSDVSKYKLMVSYYIGTSDNILKEFNRFIQANPDSPTVEYINFYLENHKNPNIEEILYDKFEKEIVKDYELENSNEPVMKDTLEVITEEDKESKGE